MRLAVVGAGLMGEAIFSGLLASAPAANGSEEGWAPSDIVVCDKRADRTAELVDAYAVAAADIGTAAQKAETVLLAVKPADVEGVLAEIGPRLSTGTLVVSVCAGVPLSKLEGGLAAGTPVIRAMPNTPARVGEGITAISPGAHASQDHLATATRILTAVGRVVEVPESYQDAVTAISGSGPAYVFLVTEALIEGGVHLGLPRDTATELAVQTLFGSATLLRESGEHPSLLRENVTSPGGTTAAALRQLEDHGVRAAFLAALEAARNRSRELGG